MPLQLFGMITTIITLITKTQMDKLRTVNVRRKSNT